MCARRFNEISQLNYEDIIDGVVNVRAETTKTFKDLHPKMTAEQYPLPKEYPIRSHDNRNFITSIISKRYGIDYIGAVCLSHHQEKSNVNVRYNDIEYEDKVKIYNEYWEILRG